MDKLFALAQDMADMLHSDCGIPITESTRAIKKGLELDMVTAGRLPNIYEQECLVFGGPLTAEVNTEQPDTSGEGNEAVNAMFPYTNAAIMSFF
jgi:hypothetical protein